MGLYDTTTLSAAIKKIFPVSCWFRNRYFITSDTDIFPTNKVLIEYKKGSRKMAPFVVPRVGGITMDREGYQSVEFEPPYIAPKRKLSIDDLNKKGFGEQLYSDKSPEQREAEVLGEDVEDLTCMIDRREEWMCSSLLFTGQILMKHYAEAYGVGTPVEKVLRYYDTSFDNVYTPKTDWNQEGASMYEDIEAMVSIMTQRGCRVTDLNMGANAWKKFITDEKVQKMYDNRNINIGSINPRELPDGVAYQGQILAGGKCLDIYVYEEQYEDEEVNTAVFMPTNSVLLIAPGVGRMLYGAITQLEQSDGKYHTYRAMKVPKYFSDSRNDLREIRIASAPVPVPNDVNGWIVSTVM